MKGEMSKMDEKSKIVEGAKQYSNYVTTNIPQLDENGNVRYYFSGSLAMLLLNEASSVKSMYLDKGGQVVRERLDFEVSEDDKQRISQGIRQIGPDVDIVVMQDRFFNKGTNAYLHLRAVRENCSLATVMCPAWETSGGTMYMDILDDERGFKGHDIAEITMQDGSKVFITDPLCMVVHKLADAIMCKLISKEFLGREDKKESIVRLQKKYEKDINDFTSMFNGIISHYEGFDFLQVINHIYETYDSTFSSIIEQDSLDILKQFYLDVKESIDEDKQECLFQFIDAVSKKNQEKIDEGHLKSNNMIIFKN